MCPRHRDHPMVSGPDVNPAGSPVDARYLPKNPMRAHILEGTSRRIAPDEKSAIFSLVANCDYPMSHHPIGWCTVEYDITGSQRISSGGHYGKHITVPDEGPHACA